MAAFSSSGICRSDASWPAEAPRQPMRTSSPRLAQSQCSSDALTLRHTSKTADLDNLMAALMEQTGQAHSDPLSNLERLHQEYDQLQASQLRSYVPTPCVQDALSQSMPALSNSKREDVGLRDLVERELKAAQEVENRRRSQSKATVSKIRYRSPSVAPRRVTAERGAESCKNTQWERVNSLLAQVNHLKKELEKMDEALQHSSEENSKLAEEKTACIAAHERDVATLEHMLTSVMAENKTLKEALTVVLQRHPPKLIPTEVPDDVERVMISTMIQSGISNVPSTPQSSGSASTETPPADPEAEDWEDCDRSRASVTATP